MPVENVSPEAAYLTKPNIVHMAHTFATVLDLYGLTAAATQARAKADAEVAAQEIRGRTRIDESHVGATTTTSGGSIKKGR